MYIKFHFTVFTHDVTGIQLKKLPYISRPLNFFFFKFNIIDVYVITEYG